LVEAIELRALGIERSRANGSGHASGFIESGDEISGQALAGDELFLGFGGDTTKSVELFPVSLQPSVLRTAAVALDGAGAGALRKQLAVVP
jgi:hypothetical protein